MSKKTPITVAHGDDIGLESFVKVNRRGRLEATEGLRTFNGKPGFILAQGQ